MKITRFAVLSATFTILVAFTMPTYAQEEGQWRLDTVSPVGNDPKLPKNAVPGSDVRGWWWLPITNVNLLIQHMNDELDFIPTPPEEPVPNLWAFPAIHNGVPIEPLEVDTTGNAVGHPIPDTARPGVALIETTNYVAVIGSGTGTEIKWLKLWIQNYIGKPVRYVIIPDVNASAWMDWYTYQQPLTVIASRALSDALFVRQAAGATSWNPASATAARRLNIVGAQLPPDTDWRLNGFSIEQFGACTPFPSLGIDCVTIEGEEQTLTLDGLGFRFINVLDDIAGLLTYVPEMETLIPPSLFDGHLANTAPLQWPVIPIRKVIAAVELMKTLDLSCYFPLRGLPLVGELENGTSTGVAYLEATWAVLSSLHAQTLNGMRQGKSLDEILAEVAIPDWAQVQCDAFQPVSPCGEFVNSLASVVKGIYTEYMGWFDGTARSLSAHVTSADKASLFLEVADDIDGLLAVARKITAAADDLAAIERALYLVEPLHELALSPEIDLLYFQLLWKAGMLQTANDLRNYYLSLAWQHKPN